MKFQADDSESEYDSHRYKTNSELQIEEEKSRVSVSYVVALLVCLGTLNSSILRTNMTIAVVEMMSNKTILQGNQTIIQEPEYKWDSKTRGFILSLFFYGYLVTPLGGYLADKYGGVRIYGYGILVTAILTFLTPINLRLNFYWFVFCRILEGVSSGIATPAIQAIATKWARPEEKSKFVSFSYTGVYIGTTISFPLCGYLAHKSDWAAIFYGTGLLAVFWALMWFLVVPADSSEDYESRSSVRLSVNSVAESKNKKFTYPWKHILTSRSLWMLSVARISYGLGYNIVILCLPLYLRDMTSYTTNQISLLSAIPNATTIFATPLLGCLADYLVHIKIFSITQVHRLYLSGCLSVAAGILIGIGFISKLSIIIVCLVFFKVLLTSAMIVVHVMPICIAPPYSSLIIGITTLWNTIALIVSPLFIGFLVTNQSLYQWRIYFISTAIAMIIGSVVFSIYSSSEIQPWAVQQDEEEEEENLNKDDLQ